MDLTPVLQSLTAAPLLAIVFGWGVLFLILGLSLSLLEVGFKDFRVRLTRRAANLPQDGVGLIALGVVILVPACSALSAAQPSSEPVRVTFDAFPDGTPITSDQILSGDEFLASGIRLSGAPEGDYCSQGTYAAVRPPHYAIQFNFLTTSTSDDANMCNGVPVAIEFTSPVRRVTLIFAGASVPYVLRAFDASGALLGTSEQPAVYGANTFQVTYSAERVVISRVTFGQTAAVTAVQEIIYER